MAGKNNRKRKADVALPKLTEHDIQSFWESAVSGDDREFWEAEFARKAPLQEKPTFGPLKGMAKKKGIAPGQNANGRPGYGSFLSKLAPLQFQMSPETVTHTPEEDALSTKRAFDRVFLPKKVDSLQKTVVKLEEELAAMKRVREVPAEGIRVHGKKEISR